MLKLGYKASAEQFAPGELLDFSCLAEEVGFDSVFVSDHFQPWKHTDGHAPSSLAWLGALGARTRRAVIGTSVLTPTFRYHPSVVAQAFGTLGAMFPGRVVLGVGTGESLNEVPSTGIAWPGFKERRDRLREAIDADPQTVDRGAGQLRGPVLPHRERDDLRQARSTRCRSRSPPRARSWRRWRAASPRASSARAARSRSSTPSCCQGRPKGSPGGARMPRSSRRMIEVKVSFDTDAQRGQGATRHWAALALSPEEKMGVEDPVEMERLADALPLDRAASRWIVSSDPDEQVERIRPYVELGFRHLVFHAPGPDQARFLKLYAEQVLPRLRKAFRLRARTSRR